VTDQPTARPRARRRQTASSDPSDTALAPGRSAKIHPPPEPVGTLDRPLLESRVADGTDRRLALIIGGAGFGKSTLAARVIAGRRSAWYALDASDRHLGSLAAGVVAALRVAVPRLPADLAAPVEGSADALDDASALARAQAAAALVDDGLQAVLEGDLTLVLDDLHVLDSAPVAWRFVEALIRQAPPGLHVLVTSRSEPPFAIERLRGQGQVMELPPGGLAFSSTEVGALVAALTGSEAVEASQAERVARRIHDATGGWPAAVRLAIEAWSSAPPSGSEAVLDRLQRPEGPLFAYLAEEVVARSPESVRSLVQRAVHFDRFSPSLLDALGVADASRVLEDLSRRALFLQPLPGEPGWYALHGLIREYTLARLPLTDDEVRVLHRAAAGWFEDHGLREAAMGSWVATGDPAGLAAFLTRHAPALALGGSGQALLDAAGTLPDDLRNPTIDRACGESALVGGDWRAATGYFQRAAGSGGRLDAATAWRMGLIHGVRGAYADALAIYDMADLDGSQPADEAMLFAWIASANYHQGNVDASRAAAERALAGAHATGDQRALAAAHTGLGMSRELEGDLTGAAAEYTAALAAAERAGDSLQAVRIRNARGVLELEAGHFDVALDLLDGAVSLADAVGFAAFHARALVNRGRAKQGTGQFEEAMADFTAAREIYERIGSPSVAYALTREGSLHALRGDAFLARTSFEAAVRAAADASDSQALAPALIGLAHSIVQDDPEGARAMADRALELGRELAPVTVLLGAGRVALALGETSDAERHALDAIAAAQARRDDPGMAAGLELLALASTNPEEASTFIGEAAAIWERTPAPYGQARNRLVRARIMGGAEGRADAVAAERIFRLMGARGPAADAAAIAEAIDRSATPTLRVQSLGRFRVVRDGVAVPTTAWQSKKARDLLKILVSRRGRPTPRETFFELLWPEDDPEPLGNRLSVALATVRSVLDPDKQHPAEHFVPADKNAIGLDLDHVDLDVEAFLEASGRATRLARQGAAAEARAALETAEGLYGGDFLEEDPYEDWAVGLREEAQAAYISIARSLAERAAVEGDADAATRYYLRIIERDAHDEGAHLGLVAALLTAGRHGEARRRYGFYVAKMNEIAVEAAPFPSPPAGPRRTAPRGELASATR
jgi:DNA-binding SARP family transcriptional activator